MNEEKEYVISRDSSDFVNISDVAGDVVLELRYYSTYNFIGDRIDGYLEPIALLTKEAAAALKAASSEAVRNGYRIKVYDAYRPQRAVEHFVRWAKDLNDTRMKSIFYPEVSKENLFLEGYIAEHSGHSRGSTVDITLFDMAKGCEADMGGYFDYFGEISHSDYKELDEKQYNNRMLLRRIMVNCGFTPLREEWWHFTLEDEPFRDTYFDFAISSR